MQAAFIQPAFREHAAAFSIATSAYKPVPEGVIGDFAGNCFRYTPPSEDHLPRSSTVPSQQLKAPLRVVEGKAKRMLIQRIDVGHRLW